MMRVIPLILILVSLFLLPQTTLADGQGPEKKQAILAALNFLDLLDQGAFDRAWDSASRLFRQKIEKKTWLEEVGHMRPVYGEKRQRALQFSKSVENAPDTAGRALLFLIFHSEFAELTAAEMVTLIKDEDQRWRVVGYSIQ